jgi:hypothetical protein
MLYREPDRSEGAVDETDYLLFSIDPEDLQQDFLEPETSFFPKLRYSFDMYHGLLLVKMPSPEHGIATGELQNEVNAELRQMGLNVVDEIAAFSGSGLRINEKGKDLDFAFGPVIPIVGQASRYTVAVEVGVSETATVLKRDIDFWLNPDAGNVNLAIAVKVSRNERQIMIDIWRRGRRGAHRVGHTALSGNTKSVTVSGDKPIILPFVDLFNRIPQPSLERNVSISEDRLRAFARKVWFQQGC